NQAAHVPDSEPPNEIDNAKSPCDRHVNAPHANATYKEPRDGDHEEIHEQECKREPEEHLPRRFQKRSEYHAADFVSNRAVVVARSDDLVRSWVEGRYRREF